MQQQHRQQTTNSKQHEERTRKLPRGEISSRGKCHARLLEGVVALCPRRACVLSSAASVSLCPLGPHVVERRGRAQHLVAVVVGMFICARHIQWRCRPQAPWSGRGWHAAATSAAAARRLQSGPCSHPRYRRPERPQERLQERQSVCPTHSNDCATATSLGHLAMPLVQTALEGPPGRSISSAHASGTNMSMALRHTHNVRLFTCVALCVLGCGSIAPSRTRFSAGPCPFLCAGRPSQSNKVHCAPPAHTAKWRAGRRGWTRETGGNG